MKNPYDFLTQLLNRQLKIQVVFLKNDIQKVCEGLINPAGETSDNFEVSGKYRVAQVIAITAPIEYPTRFFFIFDKLRA